MFPDLARDDVFRLETARLWLRWPRAADAAALHRFCSMWEVARRFRPHDNVWMEVMQELHDFDLQGQRADSAAAFNSIKRAVQAGRLLVFPAVSIAWP